MTTTVSKIGSNGSGSKYANLLRLRWPILVFPYVIGIVWTSLHPIVSVMTGKLNCRGYYIDENSLDASVFTIDSNYDAVTPQQAHRGHKSLCSSQKRPKGHISCHEHSSKLFDVAKIVPTSNAVEPTAEAIVLVVPAPISGAAWESSIFHYLILQLIHRLSQPQSCPWLAKTILVVSPQRDNIPLNETVSQFLSSYLGSATLAKDATTTEDHLPVTFTSAIIRHVLVLDVQMNESGPPRNDFFVLPQGRRGVLPNMDLVFVATSVFLRARFLDSRWQHRVSTLLSVHPYGHDDETSKMRSWIDANLQSQYLRNWANNLGNMLLFCYSLVMGPYPPHAAALDRGIDSLTLIGRFEGQPRATLSKHVVEYIQNVEHILRALSNLQERLHHSITLYLLPSPTTFVSQAEYLVPTILVLIPLVLRAVTLAFVDRKAGFHLWVLGWGLLMTTLAMTILSIAPLGDPRASTTCMAILYVFALWFLLELTGRNRSGTNAENKVVRKQMIESLQFFGCLLATYFHVPILFANVSLAYPSALLWVPLLSFPLYGHQKIGAIPRLLLFCIVVGTWPPVLIVPRIFGHYTDYVRFLYTPLHLVLSGLSILVMDVFEKDAVKFK